MSGQCWDVVPSGRDAGKGERVCWLLVGCRYSLRCDRM